jgi:hypothetical protein
LRARARLIRVFAVVLACSALTRAAAAQEPPYFVTYDHYLEERGNLDLEMSSTSGLPKGDNVAYTAPWLEVEYGVTGWWTSEVYLEGVATNGDGHGFTGWRFENRFRPLRNEHRFNPVLYLEYEHTSEASRIQKELVGAGPIEYVPISELSEERSHELEAKLILSSTVKGWNIAENLIFEKNLSEEEGVEFGYSVGLSRALGGLAGEHTCLACRERFVLGVEMYGGLGSTLGFERGEQRHYLAPVIGWQLGPHTVFKASAGLGLTSASDQCLLRFGVSYELPVGGRR